MKKVTIFLCVALTLLSGCDTQNQADGALAGALVGGTFGSKVGGMLSGRKGRDAGTVVGMVAGAVIGNAVTAPKENAYNSYDEGYQDGYNEAATQKRKGSEDENQIPAWIIIENVRFIDTDHNKAINAGEKCKLIFNVYNRGNATAYDVALYIKAEGTKRIKISPTTIIESIEPEKKVRYTADILGTKNLKDGMASFSIILGSGKKGKGTILKSFQIKTLKEKATE